MPILRPALAVAAARERFGSRRRRSYATWGTMPARASSGSTWWADDPQWFPAGAPPRAGSRVEILIDGQETFRAAWEAIQAARHSVWLVDWSMSVDMALVRGQDRDLVASAAGANGEGYTVFDLLTAAAARVDVRVLLWSGSLFFRPRAIVTRRGLKRLHQANPRIRGEADHHKRLSHCHHQKTIVIDGAIAFVGGLDMTNFDVDRWDQTGHPMRQGLNWHDLCLRLEGEAARDIGENFVQRWQAVTGEPLSLPKLEEAPTQAGPSTVQVVRTFCPGAYPFVPQGEFGIAWAYQQAFRAARSFIYLENQYLWSPAIVNELIAALKREKDPDFRIVLVLPAHPNIGKDDSDLHVRQLQEADPSGKRVRVFTLYTAEQDKKRGWCYKPIYVHAKVAIVDDAWFTVGSANLNGRGMEGDSEINAQVRDPDLARALRLRLWSEHLGLPEATLTTLSAAAAIDRLWTPLGAHARQVIDGRGGALDGGAVTYALGGMPGDFSLGELQARVLDA